MNQTRLRLSVVPRYPASVSATNGFKAVRIGADVVITPDYGQLQMFSDVEDPLNAYFMAWIQTTGEYRGISFSSFVGVIAKEIYGENLASIDALITGQNNGLYTTSKGHFATYNLSEYFRSISSALNSTELRAAIGAAANVQTIPSGGVAGQFLAKNGSDDFSVAWVDGISSSKLIDVDVLSPTNVRIPVPSFTTKGAFQVDGVEVTDGMRLLFINQTDARTNGIYIYDGVNKTLSRDPDYANGTQISAPFSVTVNDGTAYSGTTYALSSPAVATIGTSATTWASTENGAGVQRPNTTAMGHWLPQYTARPARERNIVATDIPRYRHSTGVTAFPQSIFLNLNRFGYVSNYIQATNPHSNTAAINAALREHNTLIFDKAVTLKGQITANLSGKRLVFLAQGPSGPSRVFIDSLTASFADIGGSKDVRFEGDLVIEYMARTTPTVRAVKSSSGFSNFKADRICTRNVDRAVDLQGVINGCSIDVIDVGDLATDLPLLIADASGVGSGAARTRIGRIEGFKLRETISQNVGFTYFPFFHAETVTFAGALSANRTCTLTTRNASHGKEAMFINGTTGGFGWDIGGLKTITPGQFARVKFDGTAGQWFLTAVGGF